MNYPCPCSEQVTFDEKPDGTFIICPVCGWEDDNTQSQDPGYAGGANKLSLNHAKENFAKYGAVDQEYQVKRRLPLPK